MHVLIELGTEEFLGLLVLHFEVQACRPLKDFHQVLVPQVGCHSVLWTGSSFELE